MAHPQENKNKKHGKSDKRSNPLRVVTEKALNLKTYESKVSDQKGKEADPDAEAIANHVLVVVVKVG